MRVLVCGGRDYDDAIYARMVLGDLHRKTPITTVIHGGAKGADELAGWWANGAGVELHVFRPDWNAHGKAAGPMRNAEMLSKGKPDLVVAFPGGRGTADMVRKAQTAGVPVHFAYADTHDSGKDEGT
jgi:hypothetical protein